MDNQPFISPFSLGRHEWKVKWNVSSNQDMLRLVEQEEQALTYLKVFQLITHKKFKKRLIVQHRLIKNEQEWFIYSLADKSTYWLGYGTEDVLKRLVGVDFYFELNHKLPFELKLMPSVYPFNYQLEMNGHLYQVYIDRGDNSDVTQFIERNQTICKNIRMFTIGEKITHLNSLIIPIQANAMKVRAVTDQNIYHNRSPFDLYILNNQAWIAS